MVYTYAAKGVSISRTGPGEFSTLDSEKHSTNEIQSNRS